MSEHYAASCIRCGSIPGRPDDGYCGGCRWVTEAEVDEGLRQLGAYLARWAAAENWAEAHHRSVV